MIVQVSEPKRAVRVKKNISICFGDEHEACCLVRFSKGELWKILQRYPEVDADQTELLELGNVKVVMTKKALTETFAEYFEII